jgi:hypothetical protein
MTCIINLESAAMATRINMLKLLQEVRGFAQFAHGPSAPRQAGPLFLEFRGSGRRKAVLRRKISLRIQMQEPIDIPHPVTIRHI